MYFINKKTCNKDARTYTHATAGYSSRPLSFISFVSGRWEKRKFARLFTYNEPSVVFPRWRDCNKLNKGKVNADTLTIVIENSGDYTEGEKVGCFIWRARRRLRCELLRIWVTVSLALELWLCLWPTGGRTLSHECCSCGKMADVLVWLG